MSGERYPGSPWVRVYMDLPRESHEKLKRLAAAAGMSMKAYLANLINSQKENKRA